VSEEVGRIEQGWIQLVWGRCNFWELIRKFSNKTCDPGQAIQKLLCGLHSRKTSKIPLSHKGKNYEKNGINYKIE
jgi:hypothetical protein